MTQPTKLSSDFNILYEKGQNSLIWPTKGTKKIAQDITYSTINHFVIIDKT